MFYFLPRAPDKFWFTGTKLKFFFFVKVWDKLKCLVTASDKGDGFLNIVFW